MTCRYCTPTAPLPAPGDRPCTTCRAQMRQGVIIIAVDGTPPRRLGPRAVVTEAFVRRSFRPHEAAQAALTSRVAFIPPDVWRAMNRDGALNETAGVAR